MKENLKTKSNGSDRMSGYTSPSVRVIDVEMKNGIMLNVSPSPTETGPFTPVL